MTQFDGVVVRSRLGEYHGLPIVHLWTVDGRVDGIIVVVQRGDQLVSETWLHLDLWHKIMAEQTRG